MGRTQDALQAAVAKRREQFGAVGQATGFGPPATGGTATLSGRRNASLRVLCGHLEGKKHAFDSADVVMIGRAGHNDIRFDPFEDPTVSSCHAEVRYEDGKFFLYDLGSLNGTYLNGRSVRRTCLKPGDEIGLGRQGPRMIFAIEERAPRLSKKAELARWLDVAKEENRSESSTSKEILVEDEEARLRRMERLLKVLVGVVACDFVARVITSLR